MTSTPSAIATRPVRTHLTALTGLRFFPALHVVLYHVAGSQFEGTPAWLKNIVGCGYVGVSLFFVLSGFILAYSYLDATGAKKVDKRAFWVARFARIYPVYVLGLLLMLPFYIEYLLPQMPAYKALIKGIMGMVLTLSLLQSWTPQTASLLNHPSWSLSAEAFFYLIFPFLPLFLYNLSTSRLWMALIAVWLLSLLVPLAYWLLIEPGTASNGAFWLGVIKFNPLVRLPEFVIGVLLGKLLLLQTRSDHPKASWICLVALCVAFWTLSKSSQFPYVLLSNCLLVPVFAVLIFYLSFNQGMLNAVLSFPTVMLLGEASYALYILHIPLYTMMSALAPRMGIALTSSLFLGVYLISAVLISILVFHFLEKPAREALRKRLVQHFSS